jgi:predicted DsbA family dithiol-disulfide isomerase
MKRLRNWAIGVLMAVLLLAAYADLLDLSPPPLEFRDLAFPQGFRTFVLHGSSSRFDPFVGMRPASVDDAAPKLDTHQVCDGLFRDLASPAFGSVDSPMQIAAFLDYRCPYCRTLADVLAKMHGAVRVLYKEWPILGEPSVLAAHAALAAERQGKYLPFHLRLMDTRLVPTQALVESIAVDLGMNVAQLRNDMNMNATTRELRRTGELASSLGLIGTPAMVVGRTIVQGEISPVQLQRLIEDEARPQSLKPCG